VLGTLKELPTRKLAQRELDKHLSSVNSLTYTPTRSISFRVLAEKWKTSILPSHKPSSQSNEKVHVKHLVDQFGDIEARSITGEHVQRFVQKNSQTKKPKTVRNMVATLRMIWKTAYDWGYVDRDERALLRCVRLPDAGLQDQPCLTPDQSRSVIAKADEPYKTMFWLVAETGIRGGEVCGLSVEDVDLENGIINVRRSAWRGRLQTPKTGNAVRTFAISPNLAAHIRLYLQTKWKRNEHDLLFATQRGTPFANTDVVRYRLHPILDDLEIPRPPRMGLHALRHGSATVLDQMNAPIAVRRERLGHSNFSTTMRYTHSVSDDHRKIAQELGRLFDPSCSQVSL
jgi:integrase